MSDKYGTGTADNQQIKVFLQSYRHTINFDIYMPQFPQYLTHTQNFKKSLLSHKKI